MKKNKENLTENKLIKSKEKFGTKFINVIKKRWLISGTSTILLMAILIAAVILINVIIKSFDWTPIDLTSNKEYTLTEESKERVKSIEGNVNIYFVGFEDSDSTISLAKQYSKSNSNITVETIDANERTDIATKYNVTNDSHSIIIENGERSNILYSDDLYTYDDSYNTIDITEEKLTSSILKVTSEKIPTVYFLTGYSSYSLDYSGGMNYLSRYLDDEVLNYNTLDMLVTGNIPEDCDLLIITTPSKDFDELTTNKIIEYINKGGKILWLNSSYATKTDLTNVNKILALYGINPFEVGYIYETDESRTLLGYASCIAEDLGMTKIDSKLKKVILLNSTRINYDEDKMAEQDVTKEDIILSSEKSYFRKDVSNTSIATDNDEQGSFTIGAIFTKTVSEENNESTLVIFGDNNFVSDMQISSQVYPMIFLYDNKDLALNSISYLTDQDVSITIRKNYTKESSFTATDSQKSTIMRIVFIVPIAIIIIGLVVWQVRRRKK